jgi:RNA polymerase sigma-70 factor (ECF subfamily)
MSVNQLKSNPSANGAHIASSFSELHERYHDRLCCSMLTFVSNKEAARDITAAAFATAFEHRDQFRGDSAFYTWLYAIAANKARKWRSARRTVSLDALEGPELEALTVPDATLGNLEKSQDSLRLRQALGQIPERYRRPLVQHLISGHSIKQVARTEGVPLGTMLSRLFKAKRLLRQAWDAG